MEKKKSLEYLEFHHEVVTMLGCWVHKSLEFLELNHALIPSKESRFFDNFFVPDLLESNFSAFFTLRTAV